MSVASGPASKSGFGSKLTELGVAGLGSAGLQHRVPTTENTRV